MNREKDTQSMQNIKIYLHKVTPNKINIEKLHQEFHFQNTNRILEIYSLDFGIHIVENHQIYRIEPSFREHYKMIKDYNGYDLVLDENMYTKITVLSQLPNNYLITNKTVFEFKEGSKSNITLMVECIHQKCKETFNEKLIPIDFYFVCKKDYFDIHNNFFQNELNVFLSALN